MTKKANKRTMMVLEWLREYIYQCNILLLINFINWHNICIPIIVFMLNDIYVVFWQQDNLSYYIEGN